MSTERDRRPAGAPKGLALGKAPRGLALGRAARRCGLPLIASLVLSGASTTGAEPALSGYFEQMLQVDYGPDVAGETLIDYSKLRIDLTAGSGENRFAFRGNLNAMQYHTRTGYDLALYLPEERAQELRRAGGPTRLPLPENRIYLDNAWLTWDGTPLRLRLGKQQLSWGPGHAFNPTDLFHEKNLIDPTYEKEGVAALRLDAHWGIGGQASLIMAPGATFRHSGYAVRLATYLGGLGYDLALTAHHVRDSTAVDPATLLRQEQRRDALGLELSGPLLGLGCWLEGNYNWMEAEPDFARAIGGCDYTLENGLHVMIEALVDLRGRRDAPYPLRDWLASLLCGEPIGRGWVMSGADADLSSLLRGSLYVFGAYDGSILVNPRLQWWVAQNAQLEFFGALTAGNENGAFPPGLYSIYARANVYF
ncbi:MAG: hypothetical protein GF330_07160 [Candidatus Eisenbacteria bacterium]|nr:hypothetical protein [Candidatus Eisenbacteria bacterium]